MGATQRSVIFMGNSACCLPRCKDYCLLRRRQAKPMKLSKPLALSALLLGLSVAGAPAEALEIRLDRERGASVRVGGDDRKLKPHLSVEDNRLNVDSLSQSLRLKLMSPTTGYRSAGPAVLPSARSTFPFPWTGNRRSSDRSRFRQVNRSRLVRRKSPPDERGPS